MYMCEGGCKASACRRDDCVWVSGMNGGKEKDISCRWTAVRTAAYNIINTDPIHVCVTYFIG